MQKYISITADTNDGDYTTSIHPITDDEIKSIMPVIKAIKNFKPYIGTKLEYWEHKHHSNYPTNECCREDLGEKTPKELYGHLKGFDIFDEYIPLHEYGIHTIKSIEIIQILKKLL